MTLPQRYEGISEWFSEHMPNAESELNFSSPFQLLVAVILSAQCTDKRVNMVTPALLKAFPGPSQMAEASVDEILSYIKSISYPNSKATHLAGMAKSLMENFGGEVPHTTAELETLPGVGHKTANVVASIYFGAEVIAVDTHVFRVARRIGLSRGGDVRKVENDLTAHIPAHLRAKAHHWLILHGRYVCTAKNPKCEECGIKKWCREYEKIRLSCQKAR